MSRVAKVIRELIHPLAKRSELFAEETDGAGRRLFQRGHLVRQHGHSLIQIVVEFASHAFALLFLSGEEVRRQSPELVLASAQGVCVEFAPGDVDAGADDLPDGAIRATSSDADHAITRRDPSLLTQVLS